MGQGRTKHILIVEDSADIQFLLSRLFMSEGYEVSKAFNGQEALTILSKASELPSLILLDVMMPVMDGIDFRKNQLGDSRFAHIPVVVMTAGAAEPDKTAAMKANAFVRKPIDDVESLLETAERILQQLPL